MKEKQEQCEELDLKVLDLFLETNSMTQNNVLKACGPYRKYICSRLCGQLPSSPAASGFSQPVLFSA